MTWDVDGHGDVGDEGIGDMGVVNMDRLEGTAGEKGQKQGLDGENT